VLKISKNSIVIGSITISICIIILSYSLLKHKLPWVLRSDTKNSSIQWNDEHLDKPKTSIEQTGNKNSFPDVAPEVDSIIFNNSAIRVGSPFTVPFKFTIDTVIVQDFIDTTQVEYFQRLYGWQEVLLNKEGTEKAFLVYKSLKSLNPKAAWNETEPAYLILFRDTVRQIKVFLPSLGPDRGFCATHKVSAYKIPTDHNKNIMIVRTDVEPVDGHSENYSGFRKNQFDKFIRIPGTWGWIHDGELPDTLFSEKPFATNQSYSCLSYIVPLKFNLAFDSLVIATSSPEYKSSYHISWDKDSVYVNMFKSRNTSGISKIVLLTHTTPFQTILFYYPSSFYSNTNHTFDENPWLQIKVDQNIGWINREEFFKLGIENCE
jgi:hypothetical protein